MKDREFLDKIRRLQESGKKIGLTEMQDIAGTSKKRLLFEDDSEVSTVSSDIQTIEPDEQKEEENKFKDIVSKLVKFDPIKVHRENVEWSGHLIREKIDWTFSLDDTIGCYVHTTELIQLRDETLEVLKKLRGYYDVWSDEWSSRLTGGPKPAENTETTQEPTEPQNTQEPQTGGFNF